MKNDLNNIENLFKDAFDGFEANVNPAVWTNVQHNLNATGNSVSPNKPETLVGSTSKASLTKILIAAAVAVGVAVPSYYILTSNNTDLPIKPIAQHNNVADAVDEDNVDLTKQPIQKQITNKGVSIVNAEHNVSNNTQNTEYESTSNNNVSPEKVSQSTENTQQNESSIVSQQNQSNNTQKSVEVLNPLDVRIKANTIKGVAPLDVEFNVDGNAVAYSWDFGDGSEITSQENSFHTFANSGKYLVKLTALDENANTKTVMQVITVENAVNSSLKPVATVFSPNGDGVNDILKIEGEHITQFDAIVQDSKGNIVFEWKTLDGFWDGRDLNNQLLPAGTYYIIVVAVGTDGVNHPVKQTVQLFQ